MEKAAPLWIGSSLLQNLAIEWHMKAEYLIAYAFSCYLKWIYFLYLLFHFSQNENGHLIFRISLGYITFPILMFTDSFLLLSCFITWSERKKLRSYKLQRSPMNLEISQGAAFLLSGFCLWVLPRYWATQELHLPLCRRDLTLCKDGKFHQITCH